jgi:adenine deaminase
VPRGVGAPVADPHEIANVLGLPGNNLLLDEARNLPLDVLLRVPGRVPGSTPVTAMPMATLNPAELMRVDRDRGSVTPGKRADLVVLADLATFAPAIVVHGGRTVARDGTLTDALPDPDYPRGAGPPSTWPGPRR